MKNNTIELPVLSAEFEVKPDEKLEVELSGSTLHLLKWLVAERRTNCLSLAEALAEVTEQGYKYHKRLWDAEIVRATEKKRNEAQSQFERWCALNVAKAKDAIERGYMQAQYGLLEPVIADMFRAEMAKRVKANADAEAKAKASAETSKTDVKKSA